MKTTKLSSKGQITIPKAFRHSHNWDEGRELMVIGMGDGILLKPKSPFQPTTLADVAGSLKGRKKPMTEDEINAALKQEVRRSWQ